MPSDDRSRDPDGLKLTPFWGPVEFPPPSALVNAEFGAASRRGKLHHVNEDHYAIIRLSRHQETMLTSLPEGTVPKRFDEYGYAMIVADGLGGSGTGENASRIAVSTLLHLALHFGKWNLRVDDWIAQEIMDRAQRFYRHVDATMVQERLTTGVHQLQTTLTAVFGAGRDLFFAHVGHSRAYLLRNGELMRLTRDQTIGRDHRARAPMAPLVDVNATARDLRHVLTDTIGMGGTIGPLIDLERFQLDDRDVVLLCTNGLTDVLDETIVAEQLASDRAPHEQCQQLVELAMEAGGHDDVTALVARYHLPES